MIYLLIRHGFDSMENYNPEYTKIYGYVETEEKANEIINEFNNRTEGRYEGYYTINKKLYPYLSYKKVNKI